MNEPYDSGLRAPCRDCGSTGGYVHPRCRLPSRARGLCQGCESKHSKRGTLWRYPLMTGNGLTHPRITGDYVDPYMLGCTRDQHAVIPGYDWEAVCREAVAYCWAWLALHPEQAQAVAA